MMLCVHIDIIICTYNSSVQQTSINKSHNFQHPTTQKYIPTYANKKKYIKQQFTYIFSL